MRIEQIIAAVARRLDIQVVREILSVDAFAHTSNLHVYTGLQLCTACVSPGMGLYSGSQFMLANGHPNWHSANPMAPGARLAANAGTTGGLKRPTLVHRLRKLAKRGMETLENRAS